MTTCAPRRASVQAPWSRRSYSDERVMRTSAPRSSSSATVGLPRKPAPPVTTTFLPDQKPGSGDAPRIGRRLAADLASAGEAPRMPPLRQARCAPVDPLGDSLGVLAQSHERRVRLIDPRPEAGLDAPYVRQRLVEPLQVGRVEQALLLSPDVVAGRVELVIPV